MQQSEKELFIQIYNRYLETNEREASISFVKLTPTQKRDTINMINTLEEYGYRFLCILFNLLSNLISQ